MNFLAQDEKFGELLLKNTHLTRHQLQEALDEQKFSGKILGDILLEKNYIKPHDIVKIVCIKLNIPFINQINFEDIDLNILQALPINYCKNNNVLPYAQNDEYISVLMSDPLNNNITSDLKALFKKDIKISAGTVNFIQETINKAYEKASQKMVNNLEGDFEESIDMEGPIDLLDAEDEAPVIRFVNSILFRAVKDKASDIHIEPYEKDTVFRFRINGVMQEILRQPKKTHSAIVSRLKVMGKLDIAEKRLPQDGRIKIKIAGKDVDIRVNTVPIQSGERIVMRILEKGNTILGLASLGFSPKILVILEEMCKRKHGVIYVTGPTGHGKTTTLFALLDKINTPDKMVITVEDPVEYEISGISQIQVNHKIDLTFGIALRAILRQNPDVVMVGETRDKETAEMAINASLTGHLVLSTLHTNDAASAPTRLIDMGVQPFLISSSLAGVLAQRLIRTLCENCKKPTTATETDLKLLQIHAIPPEATIFKAGECASCLSTGYKGRTSVGEFLIIDDEIRDLIIKKESSAVIKKAAMKNGFEPIRKSALDLLFAGKTSIEEIVRAINAEEES
jgi:general secretion pathway protein E